MNCISRFVNIILISFLLTGCLQFSAEWENEDILFINSQNDEEVIISQSLDYGATDSNPSTRYVILNIKSKAKTETQIKNLDSKWIELPKKIAITPFRGYMFYSGELKTVGNMGCDNFPHKNLNTFNDIILNDDQYQNINLNGAGSKYYYSCQYSNDVYNSYVFRSGGGLILQTTDKDFKTISCLELMRKMEFDQGVYKKYSRIIDNNRIELTDSINISFQGKTDSGQDSIIILIYKNRFSILESGRVRNEEDGGIGIIEIKTVANISYI